jgi:uncharacterized protein
MKTITAILCVGLFGCCAAQAQQPTAKPSALKTSDGTTTAAAATPANLLASISPAKVQDIRTLMDLAGTKARMQQVMGEMERTMKPLMSNALPAGPYREPLIDAFFVKFHSKMDLQSLLDQVVVSYDRHFTHEEIKQLIQFYDTPVGKKLTEVTPQITSEMMAQGQKLGQDLGRVAMLETLAEHPDLEKQLEEASQAAKSH